MVNFNKAAEVGVPIRKLIGIIKSSGRVDLDLVSSTKKGLENKIYSVGINRPGLSLTGFTGHFAYRKTQLLGKEEIMFLNQLEEKNDYSSCEGFFSYKIPLCIVSYNQEVPPTFLRMCEEHDIPILSSSMSTSRLVNLLIKLYDVIFAPYTNMHGTLMEIFGIGVLIQGKSGVGKSETALSLLNRGSKLIADDQVRIRRMDFDVLQGEGASFVKHHMEIRGVGIIDVQRIFGISSVKSKINIDLIVYLEEWKIGKEYDRLGIDDKTEKILGIEVPYLLLPVRHGRNIPVIVEAATRNFILKSNGYNSAKEFNNKLIENFSKNEAE